MPHVSGLNPYIKADRELMAPTGDASRDPRNFTKLAPSIPDILRSRIQYNGNGDEKAGWKQWQLFNSRKVAACKGKKGEDHRNAILGVLEEFGAFTLPNPPDGWKYLTKEEYYAKYGKEGKAPKAGELTRPIVSTNTTNTTNAPPSQGSGNQLEELPRPPLPPKDSDEYRWLSVAMLYPLSDAAKVLESAPTPTAYANWVQAKTYGPSFIQKIFESSIKVNEKRALTEIDEGRSRKSEPCMEAVQRLEDALHLRGDAK